MQLSPDSFVINNLTNINSKNSNLIITYDAETDEYSRYDMEGNSPNRRSLLKIKDHYYLYATNKNTESDSLVLIKMNNNFDMLEETNLWSPASLMHQSKVLKINNSIYGASAYDPPGDQTRHTHLKR